MIFGWIKVNRRSIETNRHTFVLSSITKYSVVPPFRIPSFFLAASGVGFTVAFHDLLYPLEVFSVLAASALAVVAGTQIAQLQLNGSDLRGTNLGHAIWGLERRLQKERAKIAVNLDLIDETDGEAGD